MVTGPDIVCITLAVILLFFAGVWVGMIWNNWNYSNKRH